MEIYNMTDVDARKRDCLKSVVYSMAKLMVDSNNSNIFDLDFCFDKDIREFKRKLDDVTVESINKNDNSLEGDNKLRYQECVIEFLSYSRKNDGGDKLFYNNSLDRLKKVFENTLRIKYERTEGNYPKISNKKQISNIIFDKENETFEAMIDYIVKNIHHENGGKPNNFTEKEYIYLWLELNKILYLLNIYSK